MNSERPKLKSDRIALRALEPTDLDLILKWENDTSLWKVSNTQMPYSREVIWHYLNTNDGDIYMTKQLRLVITLIDGTPIGTIDLTGFEPQHSRAELGMMIAPEYRGNSYADEAIDLMCDYSSNWLDIHQLFLYILDSQPGVINLFVRHGFSKCGKLKHWIKYGRKYHDVTMLQKIFE